MKIERPYRKNGKNIKCKTCGKIFYISKSRVDTAKYCSRKCKGEGSKIINICKTCGKKFWNYSRGYRPYCSKKCSGISRRTRQIIICEFCGKKKYKFKVHIESHQ